MYIIIIQVPYISMVFVFFLVIVIYNNVLKVVKPGEDNIWHIVVFHYTAREA